MATYKYDVFLSYAIEDKIELANELYQQLEQKGLKVWFAGRQLIPGNSIEDTIREGLQLSKYGVVLITPTYFEKNWTLKELYTLISREDNGDRVVIPVFHKITPEDVAKHDTAFSDRWALQTSIGLDKLSDEIVSIVKNDNTNRDTSAKSKKLIWASSITSIFLLAALLYWINHNNTVEASSFRPAIENRIHELNKSVTVDLESLINQENAQVTDRETAIQVDEYFSSLEVQYRNFYEFSNSYIEYQFQKNVDPASGFDFDTSSPINNYGFEYPNIYLIDKESQKPYLNKKFIYFNTQPVTFEITEVVDQDSLVYVSVFYQQPLRLFKVHFEFVPGTSERKHTSYMLKGLKPIEVYVFIKDSKGWILSNIQ